MNTVREVTLIKLKDASLEELESNFSLDGQVALISGASRGLGQFIGLALARAGAKVACGARSSDRAIEDARTLASQIEAFGGEALPVELDVFKPDHRSQASQETAGLINRADHC